MIHTLDFIYDLRQDTNARKSVLRWLEVSDGEPVEVGVFRLEWLIGTAKVQISLWDQSYTFRWKCPEYQCSARELAELIRKVCEGE